jgi:hypothetical protein
MRLVGRICYGIAAALGLLSLGVEWQERQRLQKQGQARRLFPQPPSHTSTLVALWAGMVALMGKVLEDTGERQPMTVEAPGSRGRTSFGAYGTYIPKPLQRAKTLRSDFDLGDQYVESRADGRPFATVH